MCSALGWGLPPAYAPLAQAASAGSAFGRAKRCIFIFLWGGPSHLDTLDPKPFAPDSIRGEFSPIATATPGLQISELLPGLAARTNDVAIVRSLNHTDAAHLSSAHATLTGHIAPVPQSDAEPPSERDTPHLGSVMSHLRPAPGGLPGFVTMPWLAYHPAAPGGQAPGQKGGWLGHRHDPLLIEGDPSHPDWEVPALRLQEALTAQRLDDRQHLLSAIDQQRQNLDRSPAGLMLGDFQQQAVELLTTPTVRDAFDVRQEPEAVRDRYGRNIHGQCVLLARRLVERGVPLVSINWHNDGSTFWDTHGQNFTKLKEKLCPPADQALVALIDDLKERGLFDDTLVVWVGEFGRTPRISDANAGREHHPFCYSGLLAGGGVRGGAVYGQSDSQGAYPAKDPVSPQDFTATLLHVLGVESAATLADREQRPHPLYAGRPLLELL